MMDDKLAEHMINTLDESIKDLKLTVTDVSRNVTETRELILGLALPDVKRKSESNSKRIAALESFNNKVQGAFVIVNIVWGIIAAVLVFIITWVFNPS